MKPATYGSEPIEAASHDARVMSVEQENATPTTAVAPQRPGRAPQRGWMARVERQRLARLYANLGSPSVNIVLWDGREVGSGDESPQCRIRIRNRRALWKLLADPLYQFGERYAAGDVEVDGDLVGFLVSVFRRTASNEQFGTAGLLSLWRHRPRPTSQKASKQNIHHHYDIGNDFYKLWLDKELAYTCAYFERPSATLEQAQLAKMDHVCRKIWLQPGETVLEAGCGWGTLALHMAREYGVRVRAYNISHEQIEFARRNVREAGLEDRVEYIEDDWRNMSGRYDAFVSVGMLEHVGRPNYRELGDAIDRCLKPHGRGLVHSIGRNRPRPFDRWTERRIFPGAYAPALGEMMDVFESRDFSVLDVENLRLHYGETLKHWLDRFEASAVTVRNMFDEKFLRMWRFYLASSRAAFEAGGLQLFQVTFARGLWNGVPRTREYIYGQGGAPHFPAGPMGGNGCSGAKS